MRSGRRLLLCSLLLVGTPVLAQTKAKPTTKPAKKVKLRFAWPVPSVFSVTTKTTDRGQTGVIRQRMRLMHSPKHKGRLLLRIDSLELLSVNGVDTTTPEMKKATSRMLAGYVQPNLLLTRTGDVVDIEGWEAIVAGSIKVLRRQQKVPNEKTLASTRKLMLSPRYRAQMKMKVAEFWQCWVGAWVGGELAPKETLSGTVKVPILGQALAEAKLSITHLGAAKGGRIQLRMVEVLEGEQARAAFWKAMKDLAAQGPRPIPDSVKLADFRRRTEIRATLDPKSLRPSVVRYDQKVMVEIAGEGKRTRVKRKEYRFDWSPKPVKKKKTAKPTSRPSSGR